MNHITDRRPDTVTDVMLVGRLGALVADIPSRLDAERDAAAAHQAVKDQLEAAGHRLATSDPAGDAEQVEAVAAACWRDAHWLRMGGGIGPDAARTEALAAELVAAVCESQRNARAARTWHHASGDAATWALDVSAPGAAQTYALTLAMRARALLLCQPVDPQPALEMAMYALDGAMIAEAGACTAMPMAFSVLARAKLAAGDTGGAMRALSDASRWLEHTAYPDRDTWALSPFRYTLASHEYVAVDVALMAADNEQQARQALAARAAYLTNVPDLSPDGKAMLGLGAAFAELHLDGPAAAEDRALLALTRLPSSNRSQVPLARAVALAGDPRMKDSGRMLRELVNDRLQPVA